MALLWVNRVLTSWKVRSCTRKHITRSWKTSQPQARTQAFLVGGYPRCYRGPHGNSHNVIGYKESMAMSQELSFPPELWSKWKTQYGIAQRLQCGSPARGWGPSLARHEVSGVLGFPQLRYSRRGTVWSLLPGTLRSGTLCCHLLQPETRLTPALFSLATPTMGPFREGHMQEALGTRLFLLHLRVCKHSHRTSCKT